MDTLIYYLGMAGTVAFAITAVLAVAPKGIDLFGATVMGIITSVGGGTVRDLILDVPVFWSNDLNYIWVASASSVAAFSAVSFFSNKQINSIMLYTDALGAALFAIEGAEKVWGLNYGLPLAPIILGIMTAIGGGLIRDILSGRQNLLMTREIYAVPVLFGCTLYVILQHWLPQYPAGNALFCTVFIFTLRCAAIHWNLSVPEWLMSNPKHE